MDWIKSILCKVQPVVMFFEWQEYRSGEYFPSFISAYWKGKVAGTWLDDCCATSICSSELFVGHVCTVTGTTHQNKSLSKKQGLTCNNGSCWSNYAAKWRIGLGNCGEVLQESEWVVKPSLGGCLYLIITGTKNFSLWENVGMKWVFSAWWVGSPWGIGGREPLFLNAERSPMMGVQASGQEGTRLVKQSELSLVATERQNQALPACAAAPVTLIAN